MPQRIVSVSAVAFCVWLVPCISARGQTTADQFNALSWSGANKGAALNLTGYHLTFNDDFNTLDVTADGGKGPWYAPVHGSFGLGTMVPPDSKNVYTVSNGNLVIDDKFINNKWYSGTMQTVDSQGRGWSQAGGYFEMRAKFPAGAGAWPSFWLKSENSIVPTETRTEIDALEWYGSDPKGLHSTTHLWPAANPQPGQLTTHVYKSDYHSEPTVGGPNAAFHTYGVMITNSSVITYYDRLETGEFPMVPEFKLPQYMLVSEAVETGQTITATDLAMSVDYVQAYALDTPEPGTAALMCAGLSVFLGSRPKTRHPIRRPGAS